MTIHSDPHPYAGRKMRIKDDVQHPQFEVAGQEVRVEDWWDRVSGQSWGDCAGNPACLIYAVRAGLHSPEPLPDDDEVIYGKTSNGLGSLFHVSELEEAA